jgi:hypothetical protein
MFVCGLLYENLLAIVTCCSNGELIFTSVIRNDLHVVFGLGRCI